MRILRITLITVLLAVLLTTLIIYFFTKSTLPEIEGTLQTAGIRHEVRIHRNRWGVPYIQAADLPDLLYAIGFVHAQDRLFQMDLSRRAAMGELSELFGPETLERDIAQKQLLLDEGVEATLAQTPPEMKDLVQHYCDGVNSFIQSDNLPPEFHLLRNTPRLWTLRDVLAVYKNIELMLADDGNELFNFTVSRMLPAERVGPLIFGGVAPFILAPGEGRGRLNNPVLATALERQSWVHEAQIGSNNWVVSGRRTASGKPMLANDPHLSNLFPGFFYQIHGSTPQHTLAGNTLPGVPFIVIGRNARIGWGFTNIGTDVIDYHILTGNPANRAQYRLDGRWETFENKRRIIRVKGRGEQVVVIRDTPFGAVHEEDGMLLAQQSLLRQPSTTLQAFYGMNTAVDLESFLRALRQFSSPAQNVVFADVDGNIGYYPTGRIPRRAVGDGALPTTVDSRQQLWQGFWPEEQKPMLLNPERGYIATANNPVLPDTEQPIFSASWTPSFRAMRIEEMLRDLTDITMNDMRTMQTDTLLKNAQFLLRKVRALRLNARTNFVLQTLLEWDCHANSGLAPYFFYNFEYLLTQRIVTPHLAGHRNQPRIPGEWLYRILNYPENEVRDPQALAWWLDDPRTTAREDLRTVVERALQDTLRLYDEDRRANPDLLKWENLHTIEYTHPLGQVFLLKPLLNRGPFPIRGGRHTVMTTSFRMRTPFRSGHLDDFRTTHTSAFRMILDFSDFNKSQLINSGGQSGHFMSPFYDDQMSLYCSQRYRPMEEPQDSYRLVLQPQR